MATSCHLVPNFAKNTYPPYWGPRTWIALHTIAANYALSPSKALQHHAVDFLESLPFVLPCGYCAWHLNKRLLASNLQEVVGSRDNFTEFIVEAHNSVTKHKNEMSGIETTSTGQWTLADAKRHYKESPCVAAMDSIWDALHLMAAAYHIPDGESWSHDGPPEVYRYRTKVFIKSLPSMLPCLASPSGNFDTSNHEFQSFVDASSLDRIVADKKSLNVFFVNVHLMLNSTTRISSVDKAKEEYFKGWKTACVSETREWLETNLYEDITTVSTCQSYTRFLDCSNGKAAVCSDGLGPTCPT
jgi:hypothetical protein